MEALAGAGYARCYSKPMAARRCGVFDMPHSTEPLVHSTAPLKLLPPRPLPLIDELGTQYPAYTPIFDRPAPWVDTYHAGIANLPVEGALIRAGVQGYLRPADALLLYEIAYCAQGDVLELGSAWGLSTSILCRAIRESGRNAKLASIEIDPNFQRTTQNTILTARLLDYFEGLTGSAAECLPVLIRQDRQFGMAFIDHDHSLASTLEACAALEHLLTPGGLAIFHDFNDARNRDEPTVYGVFQGVCEWLTHAANFDFIGMVGCCGLVQRRAA